ncbi:hydroxyacylglutathione hydrolase [Acetobacter conturbans]|uniref:Hydroxyacylglutathione hydrolase n=1 Tax=Acetobacter conturbans TaxID=1737472 RepID=A0ABX0JVA7_9PROT|nr:hydroxyacylglutathione hydrolase [Acetobacter conturbans]NHN87161.1 hydroxyacylglutathione hydrolase [Acetobacter conturbans]
MPITVLCIPVLSDNYVWMLTDEDTGCVAVVDPGECAPVRAAIEAHGGRLDLILLTHHHADHTGGAETLRDRYGAKLVGAAADAGRLPPLDMALRPGDRVAIGDSLGVVMSTPGHTLGHIAYYFDAPPSLFCGDTLFSLGCGRLFEGTSEQMYASLHEFDALPAETQVYCGHEYTESNARFALAVDPENEALKKRSEEVTALRAKGLPTVPSTLASERACNPFMLAADAGELGRLRREKDHAR